MPGYSSPEPESDGFRRQLWGTLVVLMAAGALFTLPPFAQERAAAVLRSSVLAPFLALNNAFIGAEMRARDSDRLRAVADSLTVELQARTTLEEENRRLRDLLVLRDRLPSGWIAAEAVRPGIQASQGIFHLDVGTLDGVRERAPVVTREGLAGVVRGETGGSMAVAMDWSHPQFAASAMSEDGLTFGIVESERGAFREQDRLVLLSTPFNTLLDSGTVILTSGRGGAFPRGIPIGRIERVRDEEGGFERNYYVTPFVDPSEITLVLVQTEDPAPQGSSETGTSPNDSVPGTGGPDQVSAAPDLRAAWPSGERMRANERAVLIPLWRDSVRVLRDSIRTLLGVPPDTVEGPRTPPEPPADGPGVD